MDTNLNNERFRKENKGKPFLIGYFLIILNQVLSQSQFNEIEIARYSLKAMRWGLLFFLILITIKHRRYQKEKRTLFWAVFLMVSLIEMIFLRGGILLIILSVVVIGSVKTDMKYIIKTHIAALITGIIFVVSSSFIGILENQVAYKNFDNLTGFLFKNSNLQYNLGFLNSNVAPIICVYITLYVMLLLQKKYRRRYDLYAIVANFILYLICGSRVCIILLFASIIIRNLVVLREYVSIKYFVLVCKVSLIAALLITFFLPISSLYSNQIVRKLDVMLTTRITISRNVLTLFPINLWGYENMQFLTSDLYLTMDNGYLALFVTRGAVIGLLFIISIFMMIDFAQKRKDLYLLLILLIMILDNLIDNSLLNYITFPLYIMTYNGRFEPINQKKIEPRAALLFPFPRNQEIEV